MDGYRLSIQIITVHKWVGLIENGKCHLEMDGGTTILGNLYGENAMK